jgi:uncharacterized DUF497 family protein
MADYDVLRDCTGFEWDKHNAEKNWLKHQVLPEECEGVFFNRPLVVAEDADHSEQESRYYCLGQTNQARFLFMVFTVRENLIRIISARDMSRKERNVYLSHEETEENT